MNANQKPKRTYRRSVETKQIIFDKAMAIMSEKGFQATTVREICAEANIPIGTFYNCYKSKVDILRVIYDAGDQYMRSALAAAPAGEGALEKLHSFFHHYALLNVNTGIDAMRVIFYPSNEWFSQHRPMQSTVEEIVSEGQRSGEIRRDQTAGEIVSLIFDIIRGVCYDWCICGGSFDLSARIEAHYGLLCTALKP
jgi:AcrR family transcriptional regulator